MTSGSTLLVLQEKLANKRVKADGGQQRSTFIGRRWLPLSLLYGSNVIRKYHLEEQKIPSGFQIYSDDLGVAGIHHRRDVAAKFVNQTNQWLEFEGEPLNKFDEYAIKVLGCYQQNNEIIKLHVGYVPASIAKQINRFFIYECIPRLTKTYISESGYVEIELQVLGPKGRLNEYQLLYENTNDEDEDDEE